MVIYHQNADYNMHNACVTAFESDDQHSQNGHYGQV